MWGWLLGDATITPSVVCRLSSSRCVFLQVGTCTVGRECHAVIAGCVLDRAYCLERLCGSYDVGCLVTEVEAGDLETDTELQWVDLTMIPALGTRIVGLVAVMQKHTRDSAEEWMYELEEKEQADPYSPIRRGFQALLGGEGSAREELVRMGPEVRCLPGAVRLEQIVERHGGDPKAYLAAKDELLGVLWGLHVGMSVSNPSFSASPVSKHGSLGSFGGSAMCSSSTLVRRDSSHRRPTASFHSNKLLAFSINADDPESGLGSF